MSQYKFRLQKLLDIRYEDEKKAKIYFKSAALEEKLIKDKLKKLKGKYEKANDNCGCETVVELKMRYQYLCALENSIEITEKELIEKTNELEEKRQELNDKQIKRKTVEILKEKGKTAFIKEENYKEQKNIDELALYGFIRNLKGGEKDAG